MNVGMKKIGNILARESPSLLTFFGVTGLITTVILAVKATPKALYLIEKEENEVGDYLKSLEIVKLTWKCYIPSMLLGTVTIGCIIGANSINLKRNAALASIYTLTEATLREYQEKVIETVGHNKEIKMRDSIAQDKLLRDPLENKEVIVTGKGETLFYDSLSGRYFKNDMENIRKAQNDFNSELLTEMYKPLNELYHYIGLQDTELGKNLGWDTDGLLDIHFSAKIASNGIPCIVMEYRLQPKKI
jgi:hypothetical protein